MKYLRSNMLLIGGALMAASLLAIPPATGAPVRGFQSAVAFPSNGRAVQVGSVDSQASTTNSIMAGYLADSTVSPPSKAQGTFVVPSFTCTYVESFDMSIQLNGSGGSPAVFLIVSCSGPGQTPVLNGIACVDGSCGGKQISASAGDTVSITVSLNKVAGAAKLVDVTNGQVSSTSGPGGSPGNAWFIEQNLAALIPTFTAITFSGAIVNGKPLSAQSPTKFNMTQGGVTQVSSGPLNSPGTSFTTTFDSSGPTSLLCPKVRPQRQGNPAPQSGSGFAGVYRLGDSGTTVAPTSGSGPFAPLGGVYAELLNCSPWVETGSYVSAWVMLQQFGDGNDHIQIGWEEFAGGRRETLVELQDPTDAKENPGKPFENCDDPSTLHELWCASSPLPAAPVGSYTYYTIEYHPETNQFLLYTQQIGKPRVLVAKVSSVEFRPNQANMFGETHSNYDQMPGTPEGPEVFQKAEVYNADGNGWENFYGHVNFNGASVPQGGTTFTGSANWYFESAYLPSGGPHTKSGQLLEIGDNGAW
jgi:hypothetical protein